MQYITYWQLYEPLNVFYCSLSGHVVVFASYSPYPKVGGGGARDVIADFGILDGCRGEQLIFP